ncbi:MAG: XTP/dITP diphosphatase [Thermoplasmata archaeon]|nr:XTP/dITP diphosphatase [Thermoplasmata archaeon]
MRKIWFATGNPGKLKEVQEKFSKYGIVVEQLIAPYPEIQADTLAEVVESGLSWLWGEHGKPVIIDDSGLFIDSQKGFPGVYSAYVHKTLGCQGIIQLMKGASDMKANFQCCAGYMNEDGDVTLAVGRVDGTIILEMRGDGGFGYDPIFVPAGHDRTFAEMSLEEKNKLSHRARAFEMLAEKLELNRNDAP